MSKRVTETKAKEDAREEEKIFFDRKTILKTEDIETVEHKVDQWNCWVRIKVMTGKERQAFQALIRGKDEVPVDMMETLIVSTLVDEKGDLLLKKTDIPLMQEKNSQALASIFQKAADINGLSAGAVDKAAKN